MSQIQKKFDAIVLKTPDTDVMVLAIYIVKFDQFLWFLNIIPYIWVWELEWGYLEKDSMVIFLNDRRPVKTNVRLCIFMSERVTTRQRSDGWGVVREGVWTQATDSSSYSTAKDIINNKKTMV